MKQSVWVTLVALVAMVALVRASDVMDLSAAGAFDKAAEQGGLLLEFYAPWCGHCKKLAPTYESVATKLKGEVQVGKVNGDENRDILTRFGIRGFPTVVFVKDGKVYDYKGDRSEDDLIKFAQGSYSMAENRDLPAAAAPVVAEPTVAGEEDIVVLTGKDFDSKVKTAGSKWLVEFYAPWCGFCKQFAPVYADLASELKGEVNVAKIDASSDDAPLGRRFGIRGFPTIKMIYNGSKVFDYQGDRSLEAIADWARNTDFENEEATSEYPAPRTMIAEILDAYVELGQMIKRYAFQWFWPSIAGVFSLGFLMGCALCKTPTPSPRATRPVTVVPVTATSTTTAVPVNTPTTAVPEKPVKQD